MNSRNVKFGKIMITASNFQSSCSIIVEKPVERVDFYHVSYKNYPGLLIFYYNMTAAL